VNPGYIVATLNEAYASGQFRQS